MFGTCIVGDVHLVSSLVTGNVTIIARELSMVCVKTEFIHLSETAISSDW